MPPTANAVLQVSRGHDGPVAEDMLLGIGSVHAGQTGRVDVPFSENDMHQDLIDTNGDIIRSNLKSFQQHSGSETGGHSNHPAQDTAQRAASFLIRGNTSFDINEVSADFSGVPGKPEMTESHERQSSLQKEETLKVEGGKDAKQDQTTEKWSMMANGSSSSNK